MKFEGQLLNIHIAEAGGENMNELQEATLIEGVGIKGDRYATGRGHYSDRPDIRLDKKVFVPLLNRSGLNCRIIKGGKIVAGDLITHR